MSSIKNIVATAPHIRMNQPAIRMKLGTEISINRRVLYALGNPQYINFWWSESQRVLLIGAATEETLLSFRIRERYYASKTGYKIERHQFLQAVMRIAGWHDNMICVVKGSYIPELDMVAFKLDDAEKMEVATSVAVNSDEL